MTEKHILAVDGETRLGLDVGFMRVTTLLILAKLRLSGRPTSREHFVILFDMGNLLKLIRVCNVVSSHRHAMFHWPDCRLGALGTPPGGAVSTGNLTPQSHLRRRPQQPSKPSQSIVSLAPR